jgi:hypothetical protein
MLSGYKQRRTAGNIDSTADQRTVDRGRSTRRPSSAAIFRQAEFEGRRISQTSSRASLSAGLFGFEEFLESYTRVLG